MAMKTAIASSVVVDSLTAQQLPRVRVRVADGCLDVQVRSYSLREKVFTK
jgi:hypothetical protein